VYGIANERLNSDDSDLKVMNGDKAKKIKAFAFNHCDQLLSP
jgi:hypothetical protein